MHIPDGYLSPSTAVAGYALAAPFWYFASRKVQRLLNTRLVPLIALFSAFCFVVMMFNLPIPGGTTAHALGVGIAAIVLGPWAAILALSVALLVQALFFGDGGITAFGFNSFNMGILATWVTWWTYRWIAGSSPVDARRRVVAAALAGYLGINAAALAASVELGVQPWLFHTASGAPLYAPYPLWISVPAIMIAHLTLAGLAEACCSAGILAWLQRADPALLSASLPSQDPGLPRQARRKTARRLWTALAVLMIATPLGLLASAGAWGEWSPESFTRDNALIAVQSLNHAAPTQAPEGMQRLASIWTAPIPDYAPAFMHSPAFGYLLSALVGTGVIILAFLFLSWWVRRANRASS
ncbi:Fused nickel transport protein NikMN [Castellaniella defragrans]